MSPKKTSSSMLNLTVNPVFFNRKLIVTDAVNHVMKRHRKKFKISKPISVMWHLQNEFVMQKILYIVIKNTIVRSKNL